jgi:hypothetical protein
MMEMLQAPSDNPSQIDRRGRIWQHEVGSCQLTTFLPPNGLKTGYAGSPDANFLVGDNTGCVNRPSQGLPCGNGAEGTTRNVFGGTAYMASRSAHPGGVQTVLCDGSTHFIGDDIDHETWQRLSVRDDGEPVSFPR